MPDFKTPILYILNRTSHRTYCHHKNQQKLIFHQNEYNHFFQIFQNSSGQTHYKKYFHKGWREGVRHRIKRLFLGLPLARAVRLSYQRTYSLHEPRVLAIYSSPSLTEIVVLPKLRKKQDLQL